VLVVKAVELGEVEAALASDSLELRRLVEWVVACAASVAFLERRDFRSRGALAILVGRRVRGHASCCGEGWRGV
jgi:hypothetical protein